MDLRKPLFEEEKSLKVNIPWEKNTAIGYAGGVSSLIILIIFLAIFKVDSPEYVVPNNTIPLTLLNFGDGDGTGLSKGNLTKEGKKRKGKEPNSELEDAKIATETKVNKNAETTDDLNETNDISIVDKKSSDQKEKAFDKGTDNVNIGSPDGLTDATGLGSRGSGRGAGLGFGDIEWGGGGNRVVLYKTLPKFPSDVNTSAKIKMRFTVLPDGTVGKITPLQKADPRLEEAAKEALSKWRFNPLNEDIVMVGTIPLTFRLR